MKTPVLPHAWGDAHCSTGPLVLTQPRSGLLQPLKNGHGAAPADAGQSPGDSAG